MRKGTLDSGSLTLTQITDDTASWPVDHHHRKQDGSECRLMSPAKPLCSEGWICQYKLKASWMSLDPEVACASESHLALSLMLGEKLGLISCRMPNNLFIEAS